MDLIRAVVTRTVGHYSCQAFCLAVYCVVKVVLDEGQDDSKYS